MGAAKTLLLTGATGFLGSHLTQRWVNDGHRVAVLKRRGSSLARLETVRAQITSFDIEDGVGAVFDTLGPINAVVHTACSYGRNGETAEQVFATNTGFALAVLQRAVDHKVGVFLNTDTALDKFLNPYSLSKRQFSEWGQWFAAAGRMRFVDIRLEHMYGAGDEKSKFTTHVIKSCLRNEPELRLTAGEQRRDFVHIDDVVDGYSLLLDRAGSLDSAYRSFGLGSAEAVTIREFVEMVHRITASRTELNFGAVPYRPGEVMNSEADVKDLLALGWKPRYSLLQGLTRTIEQERAT